MIKPYFLTARQEALLAQRPGRDPPNLEDFFPSDTMPISEGCDEVGRNIGRWAEEELGLATEWYGEIFVLRPDYTIRDLYLPKQPTSSPTFFEPTPNMIMECDAYLRTLRQVDPNWITMGSMHGHGRARVWGTRGLTFSLDDIFGHMTNFVQSQSLPTRDVLSETSDLSVMFNDFELALDGEWLIINDGFAYHPLLKLRHLSSDMEADVLRGLGIDPAAIGENTFLDLIASYLRTSAEVAESQGAYAIAAEQHMVRRHNFFVVYDNDGNYRAEICMLVEDAVSHNTIPVRKEVKLEPVKVDNDISVDEIHWKGRIRKAFEHIIQMQRRSYEVRFTGEIPSMGGWFSEWARRDWEDYKILPDERVDKVLPGKVTDYEQTLRFFHSVLRYLDFAAYEDHHHSQFFSDLFRLYATSESNSLTLSVYTSRDFTPGRDGSSVRINRHYDHLKDRIVNNLVKGLGMSEHRLLEMEFMRSFSEARGVVEQNLVVDEYRPKFCEAWERGKQKMIGCGGDGKD